MSTLFGSVSSPTGFEQLTEFGDEKLNRYTHVIHNARSVTVTDRLCILSVISLIGQHIVRSQWVDCSI